MNQSEQLLREVAALSPEAALHRLDSRSPGLVPAEVDARTRQNGLNRVAAERPAGWPTHLWRAWNSPFNYILLVIAISSRITGDTQVIAVIGVMIVLSTLLPFTQELRSRDAAAALRAMVRTHATVIRQADPAGSQPPSRQLPMALIRRRRPGVNALRCRTDCRPGGLPPRPWSHRQRHG